MEKQAREKLHELLAADTEPVLTDDQVRQIDDIVAHAEKELLK